MASGEVRTCVERTTKLNMLGLVRAADKGLSGDANSDGTYAHCHPGIPNLLPIETANPNLCTS
eukprot:CAMPEP_0198369352 /NCGR_PEP_ID=MMETSP1450-20131203/156164_1 /TAXON_ID=753684 ORGANISM="Madagascaria erythrocladiodes, Strain CCMP3234" /NCGR_SAMPLE_ID=MMETSP1450 /ASSEMBLY_ACC=CAM_ASM_001115 /LENGTH=62 /DNA_ID=CAMNT_0044076871 /DNA_START=352 /DNA_END=540 /DNA_ORIENTATION=-